MWRHSCRCLCRQEGAAADVHLCTFIPLVTEEGGWLPLSHSLNSTSPHRDAISRIHRPTQWMKQILNHQIEQRDYLKSEIPESESKEA